ncbi:uncharacterized protein LOC108262139 isoform X5 [Ictalurus punctatus]|uniref:Uncharacterized protein LOC108262139 isoform X5 n=1 Tax=Ictalurus punctatus TaxID=7998 RepID=A0A9F7R046_ICTPU|nr:uncharacterized protein LOC108262139 isoform X5 [Ictalurus punctatus]
MTQEIIRFFVMVLGNTMNSHKTFMERLTISQKLREVKSVNNSDVIIAFVPVVSRAGTDIGAAMAKIPQGKPVVLVVLHHTFDQDYIAPDSRLCVNRKYVFAVDCLYHEDQGLLNCLRNDDAIRAVKKHLRCDDHIEDDSSCASCLKLRKSDAETGGVIHPQFPSHGASHAPADFRSYNNVNRMQKLGGRSTLNFQAMAADKTELIPWLCAVLSSLLFYFVLPEGYSFFNFLILEIFLIIISVSLSYYSKYLKNSKYHLGKWTPWIFTGMNVVLMLVT